MSLFALPGEIMKPCCRDHIGGFPHSMNCEWADANRPRWIPKRAGSSDALHRAYMDYFKGTIIHRRRQSGRIIYLWMGIHGWPSVFSVEVLGVPKRPAMDWGVHDCVGPMDYAVALPTAEQMYELLRNNS